MKKISLFSAVFMLFLSSSGQNFGLALSFDGQDDYGVVPHNAILNPADGSWTMACWIKATDTDQSSPIVMRRYDGDPYTQYSYGFAEDDPHDPQPGKRIRVNHIQAAGVSERSGYTVNEYIDGQWHHIAIVADKDEDGIIIYVDGSAVEFVPMYYFGAWPDVQVCTELYIGRGSGSSRLEGPLDELSLWNRALKVNDINMIMANPIPAIYYETADSGVVAYYRFDAYEDLGIGTTGYNDIRDMSSFANHMGAEGDPVLVPSVSLTTIDQIKNSQQDFKMFPNPCEGALHLRYSIPVTRYSIFEVIDMNGKVVKSAELQGKEATIDLSGLPAGLYFVQFQNGNDTEVKKLVKR